MSETAFHAFLDSRPPNKERLEYLTGDIKFLVLNRFGGYEGIFHTLKQAKEQYPHALEGSPEKYKFLLSDDIKFFPFMNLRFYHLTLDSIPSVLYEIEYQKSLEKSISIVMSPIEYDYKGHDRNLKSIIDFFTSSLEKLNVDIKTIPMPEFEVVNEESFLVVPVRNIYTIKGKDWHTTYSVKLGIDLYKKAIKNSKITPYRNVFLSREDSFDTKEVSLKELKYLKNKKYVDFPKNYCRIDSEDRVVKKLQENTELDYVQSGNFKSFEDQINFFNETKVLISVTGSGLSNCMFMQPGTLVIELLTPLILGEMETDSYSQIIENHYSGLAAIFGINYMAIPHDRSAETILEKIDNLNLGFFIENYNLENFL
jgi:hypothetical protein